MTGFLDASQAAVDSRSQWSCKLSSSGEHESVPISSFFYLDIFRNEPDSDHRIVLWGPRQAVQVLQLVLWGPWKHETISRLTEEVSEQPGTVDRGGFYL